MFGRLRIFRGVEIFRGVVGISSGGCWDFFGRGRDFLGGVLDWRQCGNSLALCYFAVVMELPDSLWMNCKSEFGVIYLRCSPT